MGTVLIGGETSGTIREAFRARGHDAFSCDLLPAQDGSPFHFQCDVRGLFVPGAFDLFVTHPDCTYLTNSAAWAFSDGPYHQKVKPGTLVGAERRAAREQALQFVAEMMAAPFERICLENPPGSIGTRIDARVYGFSHAKASQYIQPNEYGEDASKKTGLWLKNLPPLKPTRKVPPRWVNGRPRWGNQTDSGQNNLTPGADRWQVRSNTYKGWAEAMAEQWGKLI